MNKNINLIRILKNCPKRTKLYSIVHGEVEFIETVGNKIIVRTVSNDARFTFIWKIVMEV